MELISLVLLIIALLFGEILIYQHTGLRGLSYRCWFSETEVTQGDTVEFTEVVTNAKVLPMPHVKAEITLSKWLHFPEAAYTVTDRSRFVTSYFVVKSRTKVTRVWQVQCEKRGIYQVERVMLVASDLLGAVRLSDRSNDVGKSIVVLPKRFTAHGQLLAKLMRYQYGEYSAHTSIYTDPCIPAGVREYVVGDPQNRIHWKASVHVGKLMLRQEEPVSNRIATVILSLQTNAADSGIMTQNTVLLEHTISVCAQCLWELMRDGWTVRLCVGEKQISKEYDRTGYGSGIQVYHRMMRCLASLTLENPVPMSGLLRASIPSVSGETILLITPYADEQVKEWKQKRQGTVLVTGHARDYANCADLVVEDEKIDRE